MLVARIKPKRCSHGFMLRPTRNTRAGTQCKLTKNANLQLGAWSTEESVTLSPKMDLELPISKYGILSFTKRRTYRPECVKIVRICGRDRYTAAATCDNYDADYGVPTERNVVKSRDVFVHIISRSSEPVTFSQAP